MKIKVGLEANESPSRGLGVRTHLAVFEGVVSEFRWKGNEQLSVSF